MLTAIRNWVLRTMMKMKGETGIVRTLPKKDIVELNTQVTAQRLMQAGIDPTTLKNADQVENIIRRLESRPTTEGITATKSAKIMDMKGKEIDPKSKIMGGKAIDDDDLPPSGIGKNFDDMVKEVLTLKKLEKGNKEGIARIRARQKMLDDAIDNVSPGFSGDRKVDAELVAEDLAERMGKVYDDLPTKERLKLYDEAYTGLSKKRAARREADADDPNYDAEPADFDPDADNETFATGGRAGFKDGMTRRTFLKILGGAMAIPIVGKFLKPFKTARGVTKVPMIKTDDVPGKPEWFDQLVNKVIIEGDDVTKRFATGERQSIHQKTLDDGSVVRVTEDVDDGAVRVEYESDESMFGEPVQLRYRKPLPDEGDPRPTAEFEVSESGIVGRADGPDDFILEGEDMIGSSIRELDSDVSKLKQYATGKGPTMKEIVQIKKRKDKVRRLNEGDPSETSQYVTDRQGDYVPEPDDFASGGIARMLGE